MELTRYNNKENIISVTGTLDEIYNLISQAKEHNNFLIHQIKTHNNFTNCTSIPPNKPDKTTTPDLKPFLHKKTQYKQLLHDLQIKRGIDPNTL
jgi:hypothetical protein